MRLYDCDFARPIILEFGVPGTQLKSLKSVYLVIRRKNHRGRNSVSVLHSNGIVEVREKDEILRGLDKNSALEGLPFMPEMYKYCGKRFRILKPLTKIFVEGIGNRDIRNTVILDGVTCDGKAHDGCQRTCFLLWKHAWLRKVPSRDTGKSSVSGNLHFEQTSSGNSRGQNLSCQLTQLPSATSRLAISIEDFVRQYSCNQRPGTSRYLGHVGALLLWLDVKTQEFLGRKKSATLHGVLNKTPAVSMSFQPGESVAVKSKEEILTTLDLRGKNRGLSFTVEMLRFCRRRFQVLKRVDRMIDEKSGRVRRIRNTVILVGATCDGSDHHGCPRNCYLLWREIWLKRADTAP
jgi:hypothetical protein